MPSSSPRSWPDWHHSCGRSPRRRVIAAVHHVPLAELLPPPNKPQWDFAKAFLGSVAVGELLRRFPAVSHVFCGHSHLPRRATLGALQAINIGSGYRQKFFEVLETDAPA